MDWNAALTQYLKLNVKTGEDVGGLLDTLGKAIQSAIERELGRTFDNVAYAEVYDGNDRTILYLRHDPIVSLSSVSIFGSAVAVQASALFDPLSPPTYPLPRCVVKDGEQAIRLTDGTTFAWGTQNVIVAYTAGLSDDTGAPPPALVQAGVVWAGLLFRERNRLGISSETISGQITMFNNNVPPDVLRMISTWRRVLIP
jgi:hypothetical protein